MKFTLGSGRYNVSSEWKHLWQANTAKGMPVGWPWVDIEVASKCDAYDEYNLLQLEGNLGHVGDLLNGTKKHELCGWSGAVLALAMIAYCNETDLIYKEQDCLAFGPWVDQMYADLGDKGMVFGRKMINAPYMPCAQSLFLIRHRFIPEFVKRYIELGPENSQDNLPEHKFAKLEAAHPQHYARLSFGYDRERPINFDDKVFYAQKLSRNELEELKRRNLI